MRIFLASPSMASSSENEKADGENVEESSQDVDDNTEYLTSELNGEEEDLSDDVILSENVVEIDVFDILNSYSHVDDDERSIWLPAHILCAAHTLNLLATRDLEEILKCSPSFRISFNRALKRVTDLWNKCNRSKKAADLAKEVLGKKILTQ